MQWWSNESPPQIKHFLLCNSSSWHHRLLLRRVGDVFQRWTCTHVYVEVSAGSFQNAAAMFSSSFFVLIHDVTEPTRQVCPLRVRGRRYSSADFTGRSQVISLSCGSGTHVSALARGHFDWEWDSYLSEWVISDLVASPMVHLSVCFYSRNVLELHAHSFTFTETHAGLTTT